jgi:hypothetical protein
MSEGPPSPVAQSRDEDGMREILARHGRNPEGLTGARTSSERPSAEPTAWLRAISDRRRKAILGGVPVAVERRKRTPGTGPEPAPGAV